MTAVATPDTFRALIKRVTDHIAERPLDSELENDLNRTFPANGEVYALIFESCRSAIAAGWMCEREAGGIKYGRVIKSVPELNGYSVDVVDMNDLRGPHHRHPNGESIIMPSRHKFGIAVVRVVYGSAHFPMVTEGRALILYCCQGRSNYSMIRAGSCRTAARAHTSRTCGSDGVSQHFDDVLGLVGGSRHV
jgi:hypothetical protein